MGLFIPEIIQKKKKGCELTTDEIEFFVKSVIRGNIDDSQIGAFLMTVSFRKLCLREVVDLTASLIASGDTLRFEKWGKSVLVDKHSTGGVGDKISLVLAPALASCGLKVPMISGRGLGFTGGTLDKMESIPGFQIHLNNARMNECLANAGCFICGATESLVPADAILYKIRDITGTADEPTLIVSSILSKKAVEGIGTLVMDVKHGRGALISTEEKAQQLASLLVEVGENLGLKMRVVISEMNIPLGRFVGNALEVVEAVLCLRNETKNHVTELVKLLGGLALESNGIVKTLEEGKELVGKTLENGEALSCFQKMLTSQGVSEENAKYLCEGKWWSVLPKAPRVTLLRSPKKGMVVNVDALDVAKASWCLGSGRPDGESRIDHSVGIVLLKTVGEEINEGEAWAEVHHSGELQVEVEALLLRSLTVKDSSLPVDYTPKTLLFH